MYDTNTQIKFKATMLKSRVHVIALMHIYLLKELYQSPGTAAATNNGTKKVIVKKILLHLMIA